MHRLFVAVDIPDALKATLATLVVRLRDARPVPADQLHLTLAFLGNVDDKVLVEVKRALATIVSVPFVMAVKGIGHFPPGRRPRVIWAGVSAGTELMDLQRKVADRIEQAGVPLEKRPFSPHITLARLKEPSIEARDIEERYGDFLSDSFPVTQFCLYSSITGPKGAVHTREQMYPLVSRQL